MTGTGKTENRIRVLREARGWSQGDLAIRAGISRTGVSAIERERLVPSVMAALALARVLEVSVEDLFGEAAPPAAPEWAWAPRSETARYWTAEVDGRIRAYPVEPTPCGELQHDGVSRGGAPPTAGAADPRSTLVVAGCDPAAALTASHFGRDGRFRMIPLLRSSRQALQLLKDGLVHVAGVHLAPSSTSEGHREILRAEFGTGLRLLRLAEWEEGVAVTAGDRRTSIRALLKPDVRWVGREVGSGARRCLDELFGKSRPLRRLASDHRGVAEAVRLGWADAGVCLRLVSDEAGLDFHSVQWESYDLCFRTELEDDPRLKALAAVLQQQGFRQAMADLPGYDVKHIGASATV